MHGTHCCRLSCNFEQDYMSPSHSWAHCIGSMPCTARRYWWLYCKQGAPQGTAHKLLPSHRLCWTSHRLCWTSHRPCWTSHRPCWMSHRLCWTSHRLCWTSHPCQRLRLTHRRAYQCRRPRRLRYRSRRQTCRSARECTGYRRAQKTHRLRLSTLTGRCPWRHSTPWDRSKARNCRQCRKQKRTAVQRGTSRSGRFDSRPESTPARAQAQTFDLTRAARSGRS